MDLRNYFNETLAEIERLKSSGAEIAMCHGVFDLIHPGHLEHFKQAKEFGEYLIVSVTVDEFVNKGPGRPLFDIETRIQFLKQIKYIDFVIPSFSPTAIDNLTVVKPRYYVKGQEYANPADDLTGNIQEEFLTVQRFGGENVFTSGRTSSSSNIINTFLQRNQNWKSWAQENKEVLLSIYDDDIYARALCTKVLILGEVIIDRYTFCKVLGKASKDPVLVFEEQRKDDFGGGVLAIARHLSKLVDSTSVFASENILNQARGGSEGSWLDEKTRWVADDSSKNDIIFKHRFVDESTSARVFETYSTKVSGLVRDEHFYNRFEEEICKADLVIVADYGHGFFDERMIKYLMNSKQYLAINCQSNAGNRGFSSISKYGRANLITLNAGELELAFRSKDIKHEDYAKTVMEKMGSDLSILTLGSKGLKIASRDSEIIEVPALADKVVDRIGAGDAVLAISALLGYLGCRPELIGLMASLMASHQVASFGQASALTWGDLRKQGKSVVM